MYKKAIVICFSMLLLGFISAPTIIVAIDDSVDISMFFNLAEEEEVSKIKLQSPNQSAEPEVLASKNALSKVEYYYKTYTKPHLNLISPPPEQHIL